MSAEANYPEPGCDEINAAYLEAWQEGRLVLQHCQDCDATIFYPRPLCPSCWSPRLDWREASGRGRIVSFSLVYRPNHEAFFDEVPIVLAEVALQEGPTMLARILCDAPERVRSDLEVSLMPSQARRFPLPTFTLMEDG